MILIEENSPTDQQVSQLGQAQECCKKEGVSKLCLGLCEKAKDQPNSVPRNIRCTAYRPKIETCLNGTHVVAGG